MTSKEAYNYLLGLLESGGDMRWSLVKESMDKFKELIDQQSILEEYNVTPEILREVLLTGQMFRNQPTLDECIKEWEDLGYELTRRERRFISFQNKEDSTFIVMTWYSEFKYEKHIRGTSTSINLKEHNLIYKTMKLFEIELGG